MPEMASCQMKAFGDFLCLFFKFGLEYAGAATGTL